MRTSPKSVHSLSITPIHHHCVETNYIGKFNRRGDIEYEKSPNGKGSFSNCCQMSLINRGTYSVRNHEWKLSHSRLRCLRISKGFPLLQWSSFY